MNQVLDTNEDEAKKGDNKKEGFKMAFRRRLFQIYFELMRERNTDWIFAAVMIIVMFLQMYGLLYNSKIAFPFKDDLYTSIYNLCDLVRIYPLIEEAQTDIYYYIAGFGFIFILLVYVFMLVYIDYSIKIDKFYFVFPLKLMRYLSSFIFWALMLPIIEIFVSIFSCSGGYHIVAIHLQCWAGMHIFYSILFSITLICYLCIFVLIAFFYNESRPYHTDAFARLDTNFETYTTLYRVVIIIIGHFLTQYKLQWLIIAIHICGSANFCKMYLKYLPYYNKKTSVLFGSGWFIYFWISINILLTKALETVDYEGQSIVILIGIILIFPAAMQIRDQKIQKKIFNKKHDKIKSEYELDLFIHKLYRLIIDQHINEVDEMILLGIVHNHQSECLNNECPLNSNEELYLPLTDSVSDRKSIYSKDPILLYHLINSIYAEYAKSSSSAAVLHTTYAYFLFYQIGNVHTALLELNVADKCDTNYQQKFTIYRAKKFIEDNLVGKFGRGKESQSGKSTFAELDVTIVITFEGLYAKLNKEIEKSANDHIEFWSHLDSQMVDLNVLHKLGLNIITNTKRINEIWHMLTKINPNYPKALQIYGNYLVQIKNDNLEGEEFINQAGAMARPKSLDEHVNDFEMMFAEDTAIVVISGNKDSQAKIMKTNNGITRLFGYNTFEVHGHEVNILMPPIIGVKHNYFLEQFFKTGKERVINNDVESFAMLRVGHIFSINLIVKPVPSLKNDIQYIGLIKPTNKDYDFILTDQFGRIDSISKGITSMLQLQATFFKENEIFIQVLCPQLCEIERIKGSKEFAMKFELWNGVKDLTFIIPKNFSNLTQKTGGRGAGGGGANNMNNINDGDEEIAANAGNRRNEPSFIGLKSPDHLKKVCNMFRNNDFKANPRKYMQNLKMNINYESPEIIRGPIKTEILNKTYGNGYLQLKVFKILNPKRIGTGADSDSEVGNQNNTGDKNIKALLEETNKKLEDIVGEELLRRINQIKLQFISIKKGVRFTGSKQKNLNIATSNAYEKAELKAYQEQIKRLETKYKEIKGKEEEEKSALIQDDDMDSPAKQGKRGQSSFDMVQMQNKQEDLLLQENSNLDYDQLKNLYPLKGNDLLDISIPSQKNVNSVNQIDNSAFQDDSMDQKRMIGINKEDIGVDLSIIESGPDLSVLHNQRLGGEMYENEDMNEGDITRKGRGMDKTRFKEDDDKFDLLKDIRKNKVEKKKPKKEEGKEEGAEGEAGTPGERVGDTAEEEDEKFMDEDTGSVASSTKSLMKHLRMLRNALYENYAPSSIINLKFYAKNMFAVLLIITVVWYVYAASIYIQLQDNIQNIYSSENRMNSLTTIGSNVRSLQAIQLGLINKTRGGVNYVLQKQNDLNSTASILQTGQNNLSTSYLTKVFTAQSNSEINPTQIQLIASNPCQLPMFYYVEVWSAMMDVSVHAYIVKDLAVSSINLNHTSVFFLITNCLNNILVSIENSTIAILNEITHISSNVENALQILLYVASGSLFLSICLIFPVATKVDKNKDELLRHFMLIDRDDVKQQLEKCRIFFNTMHDKEHMTQQNMGDLDDEEFKDEEGKDGEGEEEGQVGQGKQKKGRQRSRKNKLHKKFSTNFISLIIKFLVVVTILEGYFLLCYFESSSFLSVAISVITESGSITQRAFSNNFLYQVMQELLTTNGRALVMNQNSLTYMFYYLNLTIQQQEDFLQLHSNNQGHHSTAYNTYFNDLIYNNVCDAIFTDTTSTEYTDCGTFMGGILQKGLYSSNVAYWDNMRSMATDFNNSARDASTIKTMLNSESLTQNEQLKDNYFSISYQQLLEELNSSILYNFDGRSKQDTILFACYIVILFLLYFILWNKFIEQTRHSLWVTKSMLAIIPLEIIQKVPKIREFLLASSKNTLSAFRD